MTLDPLRRKLRAGIDYLLEPGALEARLQWPSFHWGVFRMVSRLKALRDPIDVVLDVGAHTGVFAYAMASAFPRAVIQAFEPLSQCWSDLEDVRRRVGEERMKIWRCALGSEDTRREMQISKQPASSSFLKMLREHWHLFPGTEPVAVASVPMSRLDTVAGDFSLHGSVLLKLDVQGYELEVLRGARRTLEAVRYVVCEVSVAPLYADEPTFERLHDLLRACGFRFLMPLSALVHPQTGRLVQFDALFARGDASEAAASPAALG